MGSDLAWIGSPDWPDFKVWQSSDGRWNASTNTGRPKTPIFVAWLGNLPDEQVARAVGRMKLDRLYEEAHPNGCPGSH